MSQEVNFSVDVDGLGVSGRLHRPMGEPNGKVPPAVLLCRAVLEPSEAEEDLAAALEHGLVAAGIAVATFDPRIRRGEPEEGPPPPVPDPIDCAARAFEWMTKRIDLDGLRLSVLGHGIGAIVAAGLALRTDKVHRTCLIAPATPEWLASQIMPKGSIGNGASARPNLHRHLQPLTNVPVAQALLGQHRQTLVIFGASERTQRTQVNVYEQAAATSPRHVETVLVPFADATFSTQTVRQVCVELVANFFSPHTSSQAAAR